MASAHWLFVLPLLLLCYNSYGLRKGSNQWVQRRLNTVSDCLIFKINELEGTCNDTNRMKRGYCVLITSIERNPSAKRLLEKAFRTCYQYNKPLRLPTSAPSNDTTTSATAVTNATTTTTSTTTLRTTTTTRRSFG